MKKKAKEILLIVVMLASAVSIAAGPAKRQLQGEPELAALLSIAPYADVSAKVTAFGMLIGNPVVPALMLASMQQSAVTTYGRFRTDVPVYVVSYMDGRDNDEVVVYPSVDRIARMALAHPGSERIGKDVLHLMPTERHPQDRYAVFAPDGVYTSFASSEKFARQALKDCRPSAKFSLPLVHVALRASGVRTVCQAGRKAGITNVFDMVQGFSRLDLSLDQNARGLVLSFAGVRAEGVADDAFKKHLECELHDIFGVIGDDPKLAPSVTVKTKSGGSVMGEIVLSEEQLKGLGKDFNSFVSQQMSGALSGENESKSKNMKKGAKGKVQKK